MDARRDLNMLSKPLKTIEKLTAETYAESVSCNYKREDGMNKTNCNKVANVVVVAGGLNWGLVGLLEVDLVSAIFGEGSGLSRIIYTLVGATAVYVAYTLVQGQGRSSKQ